MNIMGYDGISVTKDLEIFSNTITNRTIKYNTVEEHNAIVQEFMFRYAVCSMQLTLH